VVKNGTGKEKRGDGTLKGSRYPLSSRSMVPLRILSKEVRGGRGNIFVLDYTRLD